MRNPIAGIDRASSIVEAAADTGSNAQSDGIGWD